MYNNNCYFVSAIDGDMATATWFEARLACKDMGAELASISGDDENGYITSVVRWERVRGRVESEGERDDREMQREGGRER